MRALSEDRIQVALLVPAMIQFCLSAAPDVGQRRYETLRLIIYGASPISETVLRRAIEDMLFRHPGGRRRRDPGCATSSEAR